MGKSRETYWQSGKTEIHSRKVGENWMKKMLILLNHKLDGEQLNALAQLGYEPEYMTSEEAEIWKQVNVDTLVDDVHNILNNHQFDACLVQGHFGAVGVVLKTVGFDNCYYSHSMRDAQEERQADGTVKKVSVFKFAGFLKY